MSNFRILSGKYARRNLVLPDPKSTRPTSARVREAIFSVLQSLTYDDQTKENIQGRHVLDGFAGSGALGLEALSRGAATACFIEQNPAAYKCLYENAATIAPDDCKVFRTDLLRSKFKSQFDLVFLDPPYAKGFVEKAIKHLVQIQALAEEALLVVEVGEKETPNFPENFIILSEKIYGDTKAIFLVFM